jgi:hypothetical protein
MIWLSRSFHLMRILYLIVLWAPASSSLVVSDHLETNISNLPGQEFTPSWTFDGSLVLYSRSCYYSNINDIEALYSQSPVSQPDDRVQVIDYNQIDPPSLGFGKGIVSSSVEGKLALLQTGLRTFDEDGCLKPDHSGLQKVTFAAGVSDMSLSWSN